MLYAFPTGSNVTETARTFASRVDAVLLNLASLKGELSPDRKVPGSMHYAPSESIASEYTLPVRAGLPLCS